MSQAEVARIKAGASDQIADCVAHPRRYGAQHRNAERACEDAIVGWQLHREKLTLAGERVDGTGVGVVAVLTALLLLMGTTFVGHDWNTGSMSNQLLFDPRRGRVWTAKALAVTAVALVTAGLVSTAYWLGIWGVMHVRDLPVRDGALLDSLAFGLRGAGFAAAAALGGYALTTLFRSTVATIGVLFAVSVAGGLLVAMLGIGENWQPQKNVAAIVKNGTTYYRQVPPSCFSGARPTGQERDGTACDEQVELPARSGAGYYGAALLVAVGASTISFRRRDVG
jgi:ABC-type transport system involved in multi-copper enzyme maturation permease subunit